MIKKIGIILATIMVLIGVGGRALAADGPRDCEANSIIWCGAQTKAELINKIHNGDGHNVAANIQAIFRDRGITDAEILMAVDGQVNNQGDVLVNGQLVATGAKSIGRTFETRLGKPGWRMVASQLA